MSNFPYKFPPMDHQRKALIRARDKTSFALLHSMGTGKTFTTINLAAYRYRAKQIKAVLVICPTAIKSVWVKEIAQMSPSPTDVYVYSSGDKGLEKWLNKEVAALKYLIVGVEALSRGSAVNDSMVFAKRYQKAGFLIVADESSKLKTPKAGRTKNACKLSAKADYKMILTGTPVTQGMQDLYAQYNFLDPEILGCKSYMVFRARYCVMGGFEDRDIVGYKDVDELLELLQPYTDLVEAKDVLDLPERTFSRLHVQPTRQQVEAMESLKTLFEAESGGDILSTSTVLERMTRFQQIIGGNFPYDDVVNGGYLTKPIAGKNPMLEALMDSIDTLSVDAKVIIWARFRPEIALIVARLAASYGPEAIVEFHGGVSESQRGDAIDRFQSSTGARFFVVNQATGSMGLTLTAATVAYYYSNTFSYEERIQSEKRNYRKGQVKHCHYIDIEMDVFEDRMILHAIEKKESLASIVTQKFK